jgi:hypothetical protein
MFYHVVIETTEKIGKHGANKSYFELDRTDLSEVEERVVRPFLAKTDFQFDGYFLRHGEIRRIAVKETDKSSKQLSERANNELPPGVLIYISPSDAISSDEYSRDITNKVFEAVKSSKSTPKTAIAIERNCEMDFSRVFIVHGRDDAAKNEAARFVEKLGLVAIILHEQASGGRTIIEKIESNSNVGFAVVLYTPCDVGGIRGAQDQKSRARQNVVFEHGYLIAKLGRQNVCALVKGDIELPTKGSLSPSILRVLRQDRLEEGLSLTLEQDH